MTPTDDAWSDLGGGNVAPGTPGARPRPSCPGCGEHSQVEPQRMLPSTVGDWICWTCTTVFMGDDIEWRLMADKRHSFRCRLNATFEARQAAVSRDEPLQRGATPVSSARTLLHTRRLPS